MTKTCLPNLFVVQLVICLSCVLGPPPSPAIRVIANLFVVQFVICLSCVLGPPPAPAIRVIANLFVVQLVICLSCFLGPLPAPAIRVIANLFVVQLVICLSCVLGPPPAPAIRVIVNLFVVQLVICLSRVLGPPPAPNINLIASADFQSFNVSLSTTGSSARCVLQYSLTIIENGEPWTTMAIDSSGTVSIGGLNLCKNMYSFTAVGEAKDMNSSSGSVRGPVDFRGRFMNYSFM